MILPVLNLTVRDICTFDISTPEGSTGPEGQQVQFVHEFRLEVIYVSVITGVGVYDTIDEGNVEGNSLQHLLCEEVKGFCRNPAVLFWHLGSRYVLQKKS